MDQSKPWETAKDAAQQAGAAANEAVQRVGAQVQPALDQSKAAVQDLANRVSAAGRQAADQVGEVTSNLYDQGSRSSEYVRQYATEQPLTALLIAGLIGFTLGYLVRGR